MVKHSAGDRMARRIAPCLVRDKALHDPVLKRMKADHREPSRRRKAIARCGEPVRELIKLLIDENP